jgi:AcrR family transcriptional regulator
MTKLTKHLILEAATMLYAAPGLGTFSIRQLAAHLGTAPSVIYYHFQNENDLLRQMFDYNSTQLGIKRAKLPNPKSAKTMLKQRIDFQLENSESIVAVLKYYFTFRETFPKNKDGFVPDKSALHIEEVLEYGRMTGEFYSPNIQRDSKVIAHSINGFLLEYYPYKLNEIEKKKLINNIYAFLIRALEKGGEKDGKQ